LAFRWSYLDAAPTLQTPRPVRVVSYSLEEQLSWQDDAFQAIMHMLRWLSDITPLSDWLLVMLKAAGQAAESHYQAQQVCWRMHQLSSHSNDA